GSLLARFDFELKCPAVLLLFQSYADEISDLQYSRSRAGARPRVTGGLERQGLMPDPDIRAGLRDRLHDSAEEVPRRHLGVLPGRVDVVVDVLVAFFDEVPRPSDTVPPREAPKSPAEGLLGKALKLGVQRRVDAQSSPVQILLAVCVLEILPDL